MSTVLVQDDQFQRADSSFGSPGNSWTDLNGADWKISSNQLVSVATSGQGQKFACLRPVAETNAGQAVVVYSTAFSISGGVAGSAFEAPLRWTGSGATSSAYLMLVDFVNANLRIQSYVNNGAPTSLTNGSFTSTLNAPYVAWIGATSTDATHTNLTAKVYKTTDINTPLRTLTVTGDTTAAMQNIVGQVGMTHSTPAAQITRWQDWNWDGAIDPTLNAAGINLANPVCNSTTQTTATLSIAAGTGSFAAPLTYQWYRSTDPTFTPGAGNILSGMTGLTPAADTGLTQSTVYFYKVVATDSTVGTPLTATSGACGAYTVGNATISIGGIGDSIMANQPLDADNDIGLGTSFALALYNPLKIAGRYLEKVVLGLRNVTVSNQAVPGLTSVNWAPAVLGLPPASYKIIAGVNANVGSSNQLILGLNNLIAVSPAPQFVMVMLGANDSRPGFRTSQANYQANVLGICNVLIGNGFTPIVNYPTWVQDGADQTHDVTSISLILQYVQAINAIVNGTTILLGDTASFYFGCNNIIMFEGTSAPTSPHLGVHPNGDGAYSWGATWGQVFQSYLAPT